MNQTALRMVEFMEKISALELYNRLLESNIIDSSGSINFNLNGTSVAIDTTDIVGNCIQSWLKQWMSDSDIFCKEPESTQIFPDFYLSDNENENLLEIKAFNFLASPAFDIANFEAYCASLESKSYRLDADYLIFGYTMNNGIITIKKIWLKKIWEIAGKSNRYALNTQIKRGVIYNIRPVSNFKYDREPAFHSKEEFLAAVYSTLESYRGHDRAVSWKNNVVNNYHDFCNISLQF